MMWALRLMIPYHEALTRTLAAVRMAASERLLLSRAGGRVLRQAIVSDRPLPPADRSLRDGIAIAFDAYRGGVRHFQVSGEQRPGTEPGKLASREGAMEIMTGAAIPAGADTVVQKEDYTRGEGAAVIDTSAKLERGDWIHPEGSDRGEGACLLEPGCRLGPAALATCAAVGAHTIEVACIPEIRILTTGDEMVPVEDQPTPWQLRRSNGLMLEAILSQTGAVRVVRRHLPDQLEPVREAFAEALETAAMVLFTGGVSKGNYDFVPAVVDAFNCDVLVHGVRQRPGKPLLVAAQRKRGSLVFGLPGNPISVLTCAELYVLPALRKLLGQTEAAGHTVRLGSDVTFTPALTFTLPARCGNEDGLLTAHPVAPNNSGDLTALVNTDGFVVLDGSRNDHFDKGSPVRWVPWTAPR